MAKGTFEYTKPFVSISAERIEIEVSEGKDFTGDFVITSENHVPMRGLVYSTNPRMECLTPQFEGEEVRIHYQFHSFGLMEGDIQKGEFCIVVNQGEYNLSFVASVFRLYADSSIGKIKTLDEFGKLAKENFHEAYRLFYSPNFTNLMRADQATEVLLYKGLRQGTPSGQKVEEFLVSIDRKKEVTLSFSAESAEFFGVTQPRRENIEIVRDQPGYVDVSVTSDAEFLVPEKKRLTDEDFVGSTLSFAYYMDERAMHAGKNYGQLCFELPGETVRFSVCASREEKRKQNKSPFTGRFRNPGQH